MRTRKSIRKGLAALLAATTVFSNASMPFSAFAEETEAMSAAAAPTAAQEQPETQAATEAPAQNAESTQPKAEGNEPAQQAQAPAQAQDMPQAQTAQTQAQAPAQETGTQGQSSGEEEKKEETASAGPAYVLEDKNGYVSVSIAKRNEQAFAEGSSAMLIGNDDAQAETKAILRDNAAWLLTEEFCEGHTLDEELNYRGSLRNILKNSLEKAAQVGQTGAAIPV